MADQPDSIVFLHGHGRFGASMSRLAAAARRAGYRTFTPTYPHRRAMADIVAALRPRIGRFAAGSGGRLHIVTHSLGGLVARALLAGEGSPPVSRAVMLGPPNAGSEWADLLFRLRLERLVLGPIGGHLRTARTDGAAPGEGAPCEIGIIAGDRALDPLFPRLLVSRPNDGKVSVASTRLEGMADHIVLPVSHTLMVYDRRVIAQMLAFLARGRFDHPTPPDH